MDDQLRYQRARRQLDAIKGFYVHAVVFALVTGGLAVLNLTRGKPYWILWVLLGWGLGLALHATLVFGHRSRLLTKWEAQKLRKILAKDEARNGAPDRTGSSAS
jgi:2TM domain